MLKTAAVLGAIAVIGLILFPEFRSWTGGALPLLLVALCPLFMLFCMRSMNQNGSTGGRTPQEAPPPSATRREAQ